MCTSVLINRVYGMVIELYIFQKPSLSRIIYYAFQQPLIIIIPGRMFVFIMAKCFSCFICHCIKKHYFVPRSIPPPPKKNPFVIFAIFVYPNFKRFLAPLHLNCSSKTRVHTREKLYQSTTVWPAISRSYLTNISLTLDTNKQVIKSIYSSVLIFIVFKPAPDPYLDLFVTLLACSPPYISLHIRR